MVIFEVFVSYQVIYIACLLYSACCSYSTGSLLVVWSCYLTHMAAFLSLTFL